MAGDSLEYSIIIEDNASDVLRDIERQSESTEEALANIEEINIITEGTDDFRREIAEIEGQLQHINEMGLSAPDVAEIDEQVERIIEQNERAWVETLADVEEETEEILRQWDAAERGMAEIPDAAQESSEETSETLASKIKGLGADIAGWLSIVKDAFGELMEVIDNISDEADKLNMRMARYGMVADAEGKTGSARRERSEELYKQQQKYAQALGVQSESFSNTVLNMYANGAGVVKSIEDAQAIAASSYMALDVAGLRGSDKDAVMGEIQSMVSVGMADPDQIQEMMKIAPNVLRTIEKQWEKNQNGKAFKLGNGEMVTDATGKIAQLAQEGQITADLVVQAMINSAEETNKTWGTLPQTWEKLKNRIGVIVENTINKIIEQAGKLADDKNITNFVMGALRLGEKIVKFTTDYIAPVVGAAITAIISALTTVFETMSHWETAVPIMVAVGAAMVSVAVKAGLLAKAIGGIRIAIAAVTANPFILVAGAALAAALAVAHLVRTTQTGQEIMLDATANIAYSFQQVGAVIANLLGIGRFVLSRLAMVFQSFVMGILRGVEWALEKLAEVSDTAAEALEAVRSKEDDLAQAMDATADWGDEGLKELEAKLEANTKVWEEYKKKVPEMAEANLKINNDDLKLTGFMDDIIKELEGAPGTKNNPAEVKGKVAIDGEYFDVIKRAAGVEVVNRYTTLKPTVNAKFGDIHQIDAQDVLGELGRSIQDAEGAAISDAQALGA